MKYVNAILISAIIALSFTVGVSADYVTMLDYGMGYVQYNQTDINYVNGSGDYIDGHYIITYWALDSFDPDYTYTFTFKFKATYNLSNITNGNPYSNYSYYKLSSLPQRSTGIYTTFNKDGDYYKFTAKLNPGLIGVSGFPLYVYSVQEFNSINYGFTESSWGVYCEYDPGGQQFQSDYSSYLEDLSNQLHQGDDYTSPDSAASDLKVSLNSLDSAEASLSSKADELRTASSSTMNSALSAAKDLPNKIGTSTTFLATTFTSFWEAVPEEVTAVLLVCAAILFAGWLIGRVQ